MNRQPYRAKRGEKKVPTSIGGIPVIATHRDPVEVNGERWITLFAEDEEDQSVWEFSLTSGRTLRIFDSCGEETR